MTFFLQVDPPFVNLISKVVRCGFHFDIGLSKDHAALLSMMMSMEDTGVAPMEEGMGSFDWKSPSKSRTRSKRNFRQILSSVEFEESRLVVIIRCTMPFPYLLGTWTQWPQIMFSMRTKKTWRRMSG